MTNLKLFSSFWQIHNQLVRKWTKKQQNQNTDHNAFHCKFVTFFFLSIEWKFYVNIFKFAFFYHKISKIENMTTKIVVKQQPRLSNSTVTDWNCIQNSDCQIRNMYKLQDAPFWDSIWIKINFILILTEYKGVGHLHSMPIYTNILLKV